MEEWTNRIIIKMMAVIIVRLDFYPFRFFFPSEPERGEKLLINDFFFFLQSEIFFLSCLVKKKTGFRLML